MGNEEKMAKRMLALMESSIREASPNLIHYKTRGECLGSFILFVGAPSAYSGIALSSYS